MPDRGLPAGRWPALPAGQPGRDGHPSPVHAAGGAHLDRRGVPRRHGLGRPVRRRSGDRGARIKAAVQADVGLTASVGVATNKLVAKVASDLRKPDGLVVVPAGEEAAFLAPLPIGRLWGVGEKTAVALADYGVRTIGDLAALSGNVMEGRFGKHGASLAERARGIDTDPVHDGDPAKSVGHEHTFDRDTTDPEIIERTLLAMADGVGGRLRSAGVRAGTIAIRLRDDSFRTISRQRTLDLPTDMTERIYAVALDLARPGGRRDPGPRRPGAAARRDRLQPRGAGPARPVRCRRSAPAQGDRGGRRGPPSLRRGRDDPGATPRRAAAGAVRTRPAQSARPPRARRAGRSRHRRGSVGSCHGS